MKRLAWKIYVFIGTGNMVECNIHKASGLICKGVHRLLNLQDMINLLLIFFIIQHIGTYQTLKLCGQEVSLICKESAEILSTVVQMHQKYGDHS